MRYQLLEESPQEETGLGTLGRGALRTAARAGEAIAGAPGDIASGVLGLANVASRFATGSEIPGVSTIQEYLPTSQKVREKVTQPLTGEYLKPRTGGEELLDTLVGDVATLLAPGGIATKAGRTALTGIGKMGLKEAGKAVGKAGLKAAGAHAVGSAVGAGFGEEAGAIAKGLTLGLASTVGGRKALGKQIQTDYDAANFAIPNGTEQNAVRLRTRLGHDINELKKGVHPDKDKMISVLEGVQSNIDKKGKIPVKNLVSLKKDINRWIEDPNLPKTVKYQFGKTIDELKHDISRYAKSNPSFAEPYYRAEEIYKAMQPASELSKFAQKNLTFQKAIQHWAPLSFAGTVLNRGLGIPAKEVLRGTGIAAAGTLAARESIRLYELLKNSTTARKYYLDAAKAAAAGSTTSAIRYLHKFDKSALDYERKNPQPEQSRGRYQVLPEQETSQDVL